MTKTEIKEKICSQEMENVETTHSHGEDQSMQESESASASSMLAEDKVNQEKTKSDKL